MKKVLATALVALMVTSTVFAGFSGSFTTSYTADFAGKAYGFGTSPAVELTFDTKNFASENENSVYGKIAAKVEFDKVTEKAAFTIVPSITEASINGENWSVNIAEQAGLASFANGFAKRENKGLQKSAAPALANEVKTAQGITATYAGYSVGFGMEAKGAVAATTKDVYVLTSYETLDSSNRKTILDAAGKKYGEAVLDGTLVGSYTKVEVPVKAVPASQKYAVSFNMNPLTLAEGLTLDASAAVYTENKATSLGFGTEVAFANEDLKASVGFDGIVNLPVAKGDKAKFDADVLAKFSYAPVSVDVYYATNAQFKAGTKTVAKAAKNLLDVQVVTDLASFEVPLKITVVGTDLVNKSRGINGEVATTFEGGKAAVEAGYNFGAKAWTAGVSGEYTVADVAKFSAGFGFGGNEKKAFDTLSFKAGAENTTLIENTTLSLGYESENFLAKDKAAGKLTASVKVAF